jgi:gliding motility-associated-like protein
MKHRFLLLLALMAAAANCLAQPLSLLFSSEQTQRGDTACISLSVKDFHNIGAFQFGICWDTAALRCATADLPPGGLLPPAALLNAGEAHNGRLSVSWFSHSGLDVSLPDGAVLLHLLFLPRHCSGAAHVRLCDLPNLPIEAGSLNGNGVQVQHNVGQVSLPAHTIEATVCPGETYFFQGKNYGTAGRYTDTLRAANGCDSLVELQLIVWPAPPATAFAATVCPGETYFFQGKNYGAAGRYADTLRAANGCDSLVILELRLISKDLYAPNAFSPNDDGLNDVFSVFGGEGVASVRLLRVWDRWGGLVFEGRDLPADGSAGWDGRGCQPGQYTWQYEARLSSGRPVVGAGTVLLVR